MSIALRDRFLGCVLGCAVGDALGAPHEGLWGDTMPDKEELLADFGEFHGYPHGQWTDDTQLTLATLRAILDEGALDPSRIAAEIAQLFANTAVIGPGGACMRAAHAFLRSGDWSTSGAPEGNAGNGTAMRTAALGLWFLDREGLESEVAAISRITHQDARSVAGGVAVAKAASLLARDEVLDPGRFCSEIAGSMRAFHGDFAEHVRALPARLEEEPSVALPAIAWAGMREPEFERTTITPFVIPTVLASLYCFLREPTSWGDAVAAVIHLGGDVDTTGAIVGALAGARLGVAAIPEHLREAVHEGELIELLAGRYWRLATS